MKGEIIENKSIKKGTKKIQFSSIAAWSKGKLPKYVIVWELEKKYAKIPDIRKRRDVEATIDNYSIYYIDDENSIVPWVGDPSHEELTRTKWESDDNPIFEKLKRLAKQQNTLHRDAAITIQESSFKNGDAPNGTFRIQCEARDYTKLPKVPERNKKTLGYISIVDTCEKMLGARLRVRKYNQPLLQGERVWATEEILQMEESQKRMLELQGVSKGNASKQAKDAGELYFCMPNEDDINLSKTEFSSNFSAREDHWTGDAIDVLMTFLDENLKKTKAKEIGADLLLKEMNENPNLDEQEQIKIAKKFGKHTILREIQRRLGIEPLDSDISRGSTVTMTALQNISDAVRAKFGEEPYSHKTKSGAITHILIKLGSPSSESDKSAGGTITTFSLYKILNGLSSKSFLNEDGHLYAKESNKGVMAKKVIVSLFNRVVVNGNSYDMYSSYLSAEEILEMSVVPSFKPSHSNKRLAGNLPPKKSPVIDWQRPEDQVKIDTIAEIYSDVTNDNVMPNPVILCVNSDNKGIAEISVNPKPFFIQVGGSGEVVEHLQNLEISWPNATKEENKPLWILDGQHRIKGMSRTSGVAGGQDRSEEKIPLVILLGEKEDGDPQYEPEMLAEIFTHVTSGATAMSSIHKAWMHYSFKLPPWDTDQRQHSMATVQELCVTHRFPNGTSTTANVFEDNIQFNPEDKKFTGYYAFKFDCDAFATVIFNEYYAQISGPATLTPLELATQINAAVKALKNTDSHSESKKDGSKFFSSVVKHHRTRLAKAYLIGVLRYLRKTNKSGFTSVKDWVDFLSDKMRNFNKADWRLSWAEELSGAVGNNSDTMAQDIFERYMCATSAPKHRIVDCMMGQGGEYIIERLDWDHAKDKKLENKTTHVPSGNDISVTSGNEIFDLLGKTAFRVRVAPSTINVWLDAVIDTEQTPNVELPSGKYQKKKAITYECSEELDREPPGKKGEFQIHVRTYGYSGIEYITRIRLDG